MSDDTGSETAPSGGVRALRIAGAVLLVLGIVLVAYGVSDLFATSDSLDSDGPAHFWLAFVGLPLVGLGAACLQFGFLGKIGLFGARQSGPAIREVMRSVRGDSPATPQPGSPEPGPGGSTFCTGCGRPAAGGGRFCGGCGAALS